MNCKDCHKLLAELNPTCAECVAALQAELDKYKPIIALLKEKNGLVKSSTNENCSELVEYLRRISAQIDKLLDGLEG